MSKKTFCDNCGSEMEPAIRGIRRRSTSGVSPKEEHQERSMSDDFYVIAGEDDADDDGVYVYILWEGGDPTFIGAYQTSQAAGEAAMALNRGVVIWDKRDSFGGTMTWQQQNGHGMLFITELKVEGYDYD